MISRYLFVTAVSAVSMLVSAQTARRTTVYLSTDSTAKMEVFLPETPSGRAVVGCPGGGYSHLSINNEGLDWVSFFNEKGIAYGVLTYRMPKGDRSIPIADASAAMLTMRDSADVWQIRRDDVGIMGFSAGGHLASTISTHTDYAVRPDFTILFYPVVSMNERETHSGSVRGFLGDERNNERLVKAFSNQNAVRRHLTPPAIILLANDDRAVPPVTNGIAYYAAMRRCGNECALMVYPSGGHGFGMNPRFEYHEQMLSDLSTWLAHHKAPRRDAIRVACIGNSITDGMGIDMASKNGYPAQLQKLLGSQYVVKNFGVSSRTMLRKGDHPYMSELAWRDAQAFQPHLVIIKLGTNDSKTANWQHADEFEGDLTAMIDTLQALPSKPRIVLATPIPAFIDQWTISDSVIIYGVIPKIRKVAKQRKLAVVDLHTLMAGEGDKMQRDGIHPTDKGAQRMAEIIADELKKLKVEATKR